MAGYQCLDLRTNVTNSEESREHGMQNQMLHKGLLWGLWDGFQEVNRSTLAEAIVSGGGYKMNWAWPGNVQSKGLDQGVKHSLKTCYVLATY